MTCQEYKDEFQTVDVVSYCMVDSYVSILSLCRIER